MLTIERLKELLSYDETKGVFTRRVSCCGRKAGDVAGHLRKDGYVHIKIDNRFHLAHRLAWLYIYGTIPPEQIDHIDGRRDFNAITNLRLATRGENMQNQKRAHSSNKLGVLGVCLHKCGRYQAQIQVRGKKIYLGLFTTIEEAAAAHLEAKRRLHPFWTL